MNKHDNIYNILGKLASLEPQPPKQESMLKQLNESSSAGSAAPSVAERLTQRYQEAKQLNEYFTFDMSKGKDRGPRDTGTDELERRSKLGKDPLIKHGAEYKTKDKYGNGYKIAGPKGALPESEQRSMSRAAKGNEKYGKDGMKELAKAGRDGASEQELDKIRAKHNKYDESVEVDEDMLAKKDYDGDGEKESGKDEYMGSRDRAIKKAMGKSKEGPVKEGEYQDTVNKSKIPAFQRKAKGGDDWKLTQQDLDDEASKSPTSRAGLEKAKQRLRDQGMMEQGMEEAQYDENDAHSSLPGMRKTSDKEHSEYDAAAHTIRKWMRKRGWNTNKEFKPALKYIMDNLEDTHDDSLTDAVKEAAQICEKHHATMVEAGLDMNLLAKAQGAMRGVNTDPESERNRDKKYGSRTDKDTSTDDDYDEHGNEKKGAKKSAASDAPKKKGRPRKNFGPERTTAKAYKHKGQRVSEAISLETYVEDTMAELEAMFIVEKAKSKSQQRFFGMVHAAKKGDKPASKEVAKAAKGMSAKDAEDFAKTKHKGLPDKVKKKTNEGVNFAEMVKETGQTIEEMLMELNMEMEEFRKSGRMGDKLRDALDLHRHSRALMDSDQGKEKEMDDFFYNPDVPADEQLPMLPKEVELDELALLAGLHGGQKKLDKNKDGKLSAMDFEILRGEKKPMDESGCNMTAEGVYCEVHGMNECGAMYESKGKKPDFLDLDKDGDKDEPMADADDDKDLKECGPMGMTASMENREGMNINTSVDTNTGRKSISVSAEGEAAEELAKMLKMAGMVGAAPEKMRPELELEEYANEPEEKYAPPSSMLRTGNDLNKSKIQDPGTANRAANPLEEELAAMFKRIKDRG